MSEPREQHDLLTRYLLGVASDTERRAVEEQVFASDAELNVLLQAEDELIDDYVRGTLSPSDRRLFETNFLSTAKRKQRLEMVHSFVQVLAQMQSERRLSSESFGRSLPRQERGRVSRPVAPAEPYALAPFNKLLQWLDSNSERAAQKYEAIRKGLIRFFKSRGFNNAEELADHTFDRVASRLTQVIETYVGDPAPYFLGVAKNLIREVAAERQKAKVLEPVVSERSTGVSDREYSCLEKCLDQLSESDRDLILQLSAFDTQTKVNRYKELARSLGVSSNALRIQLHRIRQELEACVRACLNDKND